MDSSCGGRGPSAILPRQAVTVCNTPLASGAGFGSDLAERHRLRHWLRSEATWETLAAARLTHPRWVVAAARRHGMRPHWQGRVRVWSWPELVRLAQLETDRRARGVAAMAWRVGR